MTRPRLLIFLVVLAAGAGLVVFEARLVSAQHARLVTHRAHHAVLEGQLADLRRQEARVAHDLRAAERQLAALPPVIVPLAPVAATPPDAVAQAWLARTRQLRDLMAAHPELAIPEMQLLRDEDWLRVARDAALDSEPARRKALAALRTAAKSKFAKLLSAAAQKLTFGDPAKTPATTAELATYFDPPVDPALLRRYEITSPKPESSSRVRWRVQEIAAVDEEFDTRFHVDANGGHGTSGTGPSAWIDDFQPRLQRAHQAYTAANPGAKPTSLAHVLPYIQPPFPPPVVEQLLKAERERTR